MKRRILSFVIAVVLFIQYPASSVYAIDNNSFNVVSEMQENEMDEMKSEFAYDDEALDEMDEIQPELIDGYVTLNEMNGTQTILIDKDVTSADWTSVSNNNESGDEPGVSDNDIVEISVKNFPDDIFRNYLTENYDYDRDGKVDSPENITYISCQYLEVKSLKGIELFPNLSELRVSGNQLTELDVSKNDKLKDLDCSDNQLTELDVSKNEQLTSLGCSNNQLTKLDVSKNEQLTSLGCSNNQLTELDIKNNSKLISLICGENNITTLDVSKNKDLEMLQCYQNQLTELDLTKNTQLNILNCDTMDTLLTLNLRGNLNEFPLLFKIPVLYERKLIVYCDKDSWISNWCEENGVAQMNADPGEDGEILPVKIEINKMQLYMVAKEEAVLEVTKIFPESATNKTIHWNSSDAKVATVDANGKVTAVAAGEAVITASTVNQKTETCKIIVNNILPLDVNYFPSSYFRDYISSNYDNDKDGYLTQKECENVTQIILEEGKSSYSLKGIEYLSNLEELNCDGQGLFDLDISKNTKLKKLSCALNFLNELDLSKNIALVDLNCGVNNIKELDVSNNSELKVLWCAGNQLTNIDISKNMKLQEFNCNGNQLTEIDICNNKELTWFNCSNNAITELDISKNPKISALYFDNTLINEIDISNHDIGILYCANTKLTELDLSNKNIIVLDCSQNDIKELDLSSASSLMHLVCTGMKANTNVFMWNEYPILEYFIIDSTINMFSHKGSFIEDVCNDLNIPFYSEEVKITLDKKELELTPGEVTTLMAAISPENVENKTVTWSSSNKKVAVVDENGVVTAIGKGTADIIAKTYMGTSATCKVNVYEYSIQNLQIVPKDVKLLSGESEQLRLIINPLNATDKSVQWSSSDEKIVTVDQNGNITAVSTGSAIITAKSSNQIEAKCSVIVEKVPNENEILLPKDIVAVTNIHSILEDVRLPEGWKWVDETISLKYFSGGSEKIFEAVYQKEGYREVIKQIPVKIVTISKVDVIAPNIMEKGKETPIYAEIVTNGLQVPEGMLNIEWISYDDSTVSLIGNGLNINAVGKKAGNTQLSAKVILTDGDKETQFISTKKKVMVTEDAPAAIMFEMPENFVQEGNVYSYKYTNANEEAAITLQVTGTEKITLKSSDTKVVSVSKATQNKNGTWNAVLTIKKPGYIKLTATAGDSLSTNKSVELYIKDAAPNINTNTIELNHKNINGVFLSICPNNGYVIEKVSFDNTVEGYDKFQILREENTDNYKITLSGNVEKGAYKQKLKVLVEGKEYEFPITIKVTSKDPAVTVKQSAKVNLFYKNTEGMGSLEIFSDESIKDVTLIDCDFSYSFENRQLICTGNWDAPDKKGTLVIQVEGYKDPLKKNITISTEKKAPKIVLNAKTASLYPIVGIETARVNITDISNGSIIQPEEIQVTFKPIKGKAVTAYNIQKNQNEIIFTRTEKDFKTKVSADILIQKKEYAAPIKLTYAINVNEKLPALTLDKKTVILNKAIAVHEYHQVKAYPKDTQAEDILQIRVTPADAKSKAEKDSSIAISVQDKNTLAVGLNDVTDLKTGNYKFNIDANYNGQKCQKTVLTVKVVDTSPNKTVKVTPKGSIDLLNRDTTCIYYTPKISNITGEIVDVSLSGRSAHLFKAELEDGKIKVSVTGNTKEEQDKVALVTKYKYRICLKLIFDNGLQSYEVTTDELKITLKQTKPKVTIQPKQSVMFNTLEHRIKVEFKGVNKDKTFAPIKKIELTNFKNVFFFDEKQNEILLTDKCSVVKGKTYTLKFNIYFEGCGDNEKPVQVNYKVKIQ